MKKILSITFCCILFLHVAVPVPAQVRQLKRNNSEAPATNAPGPAVGAPATAVKAMAFNKIELLSNPTKLLVLGKRMFAEAIQPFVDHKNRQGITTGFVDIESLKTFPGEDEPARIKRAIADAYLIRGVRYVMLVGDAALFPVRHRFVSNGWANGRTGSPEYQWFEGSYNPTDLYYANLFHHDENGQVLPQPSFSSWDEDQDGYYNYQVWQFPGAEQMGIDAIKINPDNVDGYPDVALARLPVHSVYELSAYIEKVIRYETGQMIPESHSGLAFLASGAYPSSQQLCQQIINYVSPGNIPSQDIQKLAFNFKQTPAGWDEGNFASIKNAAVFNWGIIYMGHASSATWEIEEDGKTFNDSVINTFRNPASLPVVFTIGCQSGAFKPNIPDCVPAPAGPYPDINGKEQYYTKSADGKYYYMGVWQELPKPFRLPQPSPYDFPGSYARTFASPWLCHPYGGGAIAFFGETAVCENSHGTELIKRVLKTCLAQPAFLGDAWLEGQRQYWKDFRSNNGVFRNPRIYLSIMTFFGDPTLQLKNP